MDMTQITGQNFIGQRSGAGAVHLQSLDATTGEALPYQFVQATDAEVDSAANAASAAFAAFRSCPPAAVRNF
jgi:NADP-dependent aldehyde dehydrogenase